MGDWLRVYNTADVLFYLLSRLERRLCYTTLMQLVSQVYHWRTY